MVLNAFLFRVGALHVMPQGKAQPFRVNTAIHNGYTADVGEVQSQTVRDNLRDGFEPPVLLSGALNLLPTVPANMSGQATISGLEQWDNPGSRFRSR